MSCPPYRMAALFACLCASGFANAQTPPASPKEWLDADEQPCFLIQDIHWHAGQDKVPTFLAGSVALTPNGQRDEPQGRCLGANGIQQLIDRAQNALIHHGFVTSRVLAGPQNLQNGVLELEVLMGKVQSLAWASSDESTPRRAQFWNTVPIQKNEVLNLRDIEQGLENFKRVPTADADIEVLPGEEAGQSVLSIRHSQTQLLRFNLNIDDAGTPSTGKLQASATLSADNWLTLSDLMYVTLQQDVGGDKDPGSRGTRGQTWHYSLPLGYQTLAFNHSRSTYFQTVAGLNQDYVYAGSSENSDIKLSRVMHRDASSKTSLGTQAFQRKSNNFIDGSELEVQKRVVGGWVWDIAHKQSLGKASVDTSLAYKKGTGDFGALAAPEEAFGEGTSRMRIWTSDTQLMVPFALAEQPLTYSLNARVQWNQTRLTPQDRFSIGGRYTVRGFDGINSLTGDRGWLLRQEIQTPLGSEHKLYVGLDKGRVDGASAENLLGKELVGAVIGVRAQHGAAQYDLFLGGPLKAPDRFKTSALTSGFSFTLSF